MLSFIPIGERRSHTLPAPQSYLPASQPYLPAPQSYLSESRRAGKKLNGATPNIIGSAPVPGLRASAVG
jgi:hypothetical protein